VGASPDAEDAPFLVEADEGGAQRLHVLSDDRLGADVASRAQPPTTMRAGRPDRIVPSRYSIRPGERQRSQRDAEVDKCGSFIACYVNRSLALDVGHLDDRPPLLDLSFLQRAERIGRLLRWRKSGNCCPLASGTRLIIARNRPVLRRGSIRKVEKNFVYITPAPVFRRIVALNDRVRGGVKMFGCMSVRRVIATADVTAGPANTQVNPGRTDL
jgi:hypothetical protein